MKAKIHIPESLNEVSLVQYQDFLSKSEGMQDERLKKQLVSSFCKIDFNLVDTIRITDILEFSDIIDKMFDSEFPFIPKFKIDGASFGFIPNLEEMTFGEYVDLDNYIGDWSKMHKAMAILFRPITKEYKGKYQIEDYENSDKYAEVMKLMPLSCAFGAVVFFYRLGNELLKAIPHFLEKQIAEMNKEISPNKHNSINNGDGIQQSINLLRATLEDLTKSLHLDWRQH